MSLRKGQAKVIHVQRSLIKRASVGPLIDGHQIVQVQRRRQSTPPKRSDNQYSNDRKITENSLNGRKTVSDNSPCKNNSTQIQGVNSLNHDFGVVAVPPFSSSTVFGPNSNVLPRLSNDPLTNGSKAQFSKTIPTSRMDESPSFSDTSHKNWSSTNSLGRFGNILFNKDHKNDFSRRRQKWRVDREKKRRRLGGCYKCNQCCCYCVMALIFGAILLATLIATILLMALRPPNLKTATTAMATELTTTVTLTTTIASSFMSNTTPLTTSAIPTTSTITTTLMLSGNTSITTTLSSSMTTVLTSSLVPNSSSITSIPGSTTTTDTSTSLTTTTTTSEITTDTSTSLTTTTTTSETTTSLISTTSSVTSTVSSTATSSSTSTNSITSTTATTSVATTTSTTATITTTASTSTSVTTSTRTTSTSTVSITTTTTTISTSTLGPTTTAFNSCALLRWATTGTVVAGSSSSGSGSNQLNKPAFIYIDKNDTLFIADTENNRIQKYTRGAASGVTVADASDGLNKPEGLTFDKNGYMYVTGGTDHRVLRFTPPNFLTATNVAGVQGSAGSSLTQLNKPLGLAVDDNMNLYIAERDGQRVMRWAPNATSGTVVVSPSPARKFNGVLPSLYSSNQIYISSEEKYEAYLWTLNAATPALTMKQVTTGSDMNNPNGIKYDKYGNLYVVDRGTKRIVMYCQNSTIGRVALNGGSSSPNLNYAYDVAFDSDVNMYVSDESANYVIRFNRI